MPAIVESQGDSPLLMPIRQRADLHIGQDLLEGKICICDELFIDNQGRVTGS